MYCSTCGTQSIQGLNYCNRCGATLNTQALVAAPPLSITKPTAVLGGLVAFITICGFVAVVAGASELARKGFDHDQGMVLLSMGMATILVVDILLLRLLSRIVNASLQAGTNAPSKQIREKAETGPETQRKLNAPTFEPAASVTENTTRTFEPVYRETSR